MLDPELPFHHRVRLATRKNQRQLAELLGISLRSISRWVAGNGLSGPTLPKHYAALAQASFPNDRELAAECAAAAGTTLEDLGLVPRPLPPPAPPQAPPPPKQVVTPGQADAIVCAVADLRDVPPREVRAMVAVAFARAHELGFTTEAVAKALVAHLPAAPAKKGSGGT